MTSKGQIFLQLAIFFSICFLSSSSFPAVGISFQRYFTSVWVSSTSVCKTYLFPLGIYWGSTWGTSVAWRPRRDSTSPSLERSQLHQPRSQTGNGVGILPLKFRHSRRGAFQQVETTWAWTSAHKHAVKGEFRSNILLYLETVSINWVQLFLKTYSGAIWESYVYWYSPTRTRKIDSQKIDRE